MLHYVTFMYNLLPNLVGVEDEQFLYVLNTNLYVLNTNLSDINFNFSFFPHP